MGVLDRLGRFDDKTLLYRAGEGRVASPRTVVVVLIAGQVIAAIAVAVVLALFGPAALPVGFGLDIAFVVAYVVWRRRRNRCLTGSPTTSPS